MSALQKTGKIEDAGYNKLTSKANAESEYFKKYQSGGVVGMKSMFESGPTFSIHVTSTHQQQQQENRESSAPPTSAPHFRWSQRFEKDLPADSYTEAQKQNQFRSYYKYHPSDAPKIPSRLESRMYFKNLKDLTSAGSRNPVYCSVQSNGSAGVGDCAKLSTDDIVSTTTTNNNNNVTNEDADASAMENNHAKKSGATLKLVKTTSPILPKQEPKFDFSNAPRSMSSSLHSDVPLTSSKVGAFVSKFDGDATNNILATSIHTDQPASLPAFRLDAFCTDSKNTNNTTGPQGIQFHTISRH